MKKINIGTKSELKDFVHFIEPDKFRRLDDDFYVEQLEAIVEALRRGRSLNAGHTSFRSLGGSKWVAGDGSEVEATLVGLIVGWFDRGWEDEFTSDPEYAVERFVIGHCDQRKYQDGRVRGDF